MATSAAKLPSSRRSSSLAGPTAASIARGATARSAVSPKVNASLSGFNRRGSLSRPIPLAAQNNEHGLLARDELSAALKRETEEKEELLVRIQTKEQNISELKSENMSLSTALNTTEARLTELYADQARIEEETVSRLELVDRLRGQVQELEREKRDILRRYNEQTATFDAERQSFYDNEQHLKSRIQSLIQARKVAELLPKPSIQSFAETINDDGTRSLAEEFGTKLDVTSTGKSESDDEDEPAEMTALRLELSTLSTSYSSLQNTVQHLSSQLLDLKRVNNQLQEENESYNILLREKTLNGQFDILKSVSAKEVDATSSDEEDNYDDTEEYEKEDHTSLGARTPLDPVDELAEDMDSAVYGEEAEQDTLVQDDSGSISSSEKRDKSRRTGRGGRRIKNSSPPPKGESLADLPVAGPGLDLAAELGRAENQAIIDGGADPTTRDRSSSNAKGKRGRQAVEKKASEAKSDSNGDLDALRNEVKSLKDANKALSLYASKIIDRIIAQEGFEHVLAADYEKPPPSPVKKQIAKKPSKDEISKAKPRPQSAIFGLAFPSSEPPAQPNQSNVSPSNDNSPPNAEKATRAQRRSMSFDWKGFSMFGGSSEKKVEPNPNLRPLSLRPGASSVVSARKLDTTEDDEDRRERERLHATMKLMGINKPMTSAPPTPSATSTKTFANATLASPNPQIETTSPKTAITSRFSFFRSRSNPSDNSLNTPTQASAQSGSLTAEALERAEAETTLAALDEREKTLSAEIAKGSNGGFTDLPSRRQRGEGRSRKSRKSGESGSGSTVWSAGMSTHREEDSATEDT